MILLLILVKGGGGEGGRRRRRRGEKKEDERQTKGVTRSNTVISTSRTKHMKGSKERLFIRTQTHNLQIFGVTPFVKLQNDT